MNVDETGKQSDNDSILVGHDTVSLGNLLPTSLKNTESASPLSGIMDQPEADSVLLIHL
jgi:hypothetical protein